MRVFALLALCIAAAAAVPSNPQRIVGGSVTTIETWPQMASLLYSWNLVTYSQTCGGSILNNRAILTAAHCTIGDGANRWRSRVGSTWANSGGVVHNSASIINHPSYNSRTYDNDISIIRTATTIVHNNAARPASIAGANYNLGDNQVVWATGWGATSELALGQCKRDRSYTQAHKFLHPVEGCDTGQVQGGSLSPQLRQVQIWTVNQNVCNQRYGGAITANMLCSGWLDVGGRDQCQGDSGGPLFHNGIVVGVCSWGNGCAQAFFPGVNARVSRFTAWIQSNA